MRRDHVELENLIAGLQSCADALGAPHSLVSGRLTAAGAASVVAYAEYAMEHPTSRAILIEWALKIDSSVGRGAALPGPGLEQLLIDALTAARGAPRSDWPVEDQQLFETEWEAMNRELAVERIQSFVGAFEHRTPLARSLEAWTEFEHLKAAVIAAKREFDASYLRGLGRPESGAELIVQLHEALAGAEGFVGELHRRALALYSHGGGLRLENGPFGRASGAELVHELLRTNIWLVSRLRSTESASLAIHRFAERVTLFESERYRALAAEAPSTAPDRVEQALRHGLDLYMHDRGHLTLREATLGAGRADLLQVEGLSRVAVEVKYIGAKRAISSQLRKGLGQALYYARAVGAARASVLCFVNLPDSLVVEPAEAAYGAVTISVVVVDIGTKPSARRKVQRIALPASSKVERAAVEAETAAGPHPGHARTQPGR